MNEYTQKKIEAFMRILKQLGLSKTQICGICSYARKGRNATRNAESTRSKEFQSDTAGNDEYLRSGDKGVNEPLDEEQYSVGSPLQQMRDNLSKYDSDEINDEEYYSENDRLWGEAIETYGKKFNEKRRLCAS